MKRTILYKLLMPVFICMAFNITSCKKFIEIDPSPNLIVSSAVFNDDATAVSAVTGLYVDMRNVVNHFTNGGMSLFGGLSADEIYNTSTSSTYDPFVMNALQPANGNVNSNFYGIGYKNIYRVNSVLEGLHASTGLTDSIKRQLEGEMKFARAFHYFYLVNLFGGVPLITVTDYKANAQLPRTNVQEIYSQVVNDLVSAHGLLSASYAGSFKARPNKWTAAALLARVYLYMEDWVNAEAHASSVLNSGAYNLEADPDNVFLRGSTEIIWQIPPANETVNTAQAGFYIPSSSTVKPAFAITNSLLNSFETTDKRKTKWLRSNTIAGVSYFYPYKYKSRQTTTPVAEYNVIMRLGEQYLIRAEARAQQNKIADALNDLNRIRTRAGLTQNISSSKQQLLDAIARERQVELFTEWGDRWLELKRTKRIDSVMTFVKGSNWQGTDALYPIPQNELEYNPLLTQNPGYF